MRPFLHGILLLKTWGQVGTASVAHSGTTTMIRDWSEVTLAEVCTKIVSGATPWGSKDVYLDEGACRLISNQNAYNDGFHHQGLVFIGERHADELQNVEVFEEDVLLSITGDSVARVCQVAPEVLPARVISTLPSSGWTRLTEVTDSTVGDPTSTARVWRNFSLG